MVKHPKKESSEFACQQWRLIVFSNQKKFYWPTFLGECKHRIKQKKIKSFTKIELKSPSDDGLFIYLFIHLFIYLFAFFKVD